MIADCTGCCSKTALTEMSLLGTKWGRVNSHYTLVPEIVRAHNLETYFSDGFSCTNRKTSSNGLKYHNKVDALISFHFTAVFSLISVVLYKQMFGLTRWGGMVSLPLRTCHLLD